MYLNRQLFQIEDAAVILTQLLNTIFRNIISTNKVFKKICSYPFIILHVTLLDWKLFDEVRIHQLEREVSYSCWAATSQLHLIMCGMLRGHDYYTPAL